MSNNAIAIRGSNFYLDLDGANKELEPLSAVERIQWADEEIGANHRLYSLTSGGIHSAVLPRLIQKAGLQIPEVLIDTGNLFPETRRYAGEIARLHGLPLHVTTSLLGELSDAEARKLYDEDPEQYKQTTKLEPLRQAINDRRITGLLSGVRAGQTENRASLDFIEEGSSDEVVRIHPILDWSEDDVIDFMHAESLPEHPLLSKGYNSVGDRITTVPGEGREGRLLGEHRECGLHLK